jgi:phosphoribosylaminoimidazolecarboxamide formyltransferase/IMP cyclohydrolase
VSRATRFGLAHKAFRHTAHYDALIAGFLEARAPRLDGSLGLPDAPHFPALLHLTLEKVQDLRYGENPHQRAALYRRRPAGPGARQIQGKELSYNNVLDVEAAWALAQDLDEPAVVVVKHTNPCGVAVGGDQAAAFVRARATDPVSAFGGIVALNRRLEGRTAEVMAAGFLEVVVAPGVSAEARERLAAKPQLRLLEPPPAGAGSPPFEVRQVGGGVLVQEPDAVEPEAPAWRVVTRRPPGADELRGLRLAWRVAKHVKSNAIVLATAEATVGIGAGQMSRVDSVRLAVSKAVLPTAGTVLASDAFFPFRDGLDAAAAAGVTAVVQPGGSVRDAEAIAAADEHGMAMVFTGIRHFRH